MKKSLFIILVLILLLKVAVAQNQVTYTPNLNLAQPPAGYLNWTNLVNANWSILDNSIGGLQSQFQGNWLVSTNYSKGTSVLYNNQLYVSKSIGNIANSPETSPTFWDNVSTLLPGAIVMGTGTNQQILFPGLLSVASLIPAGGPYLDITNPLFGGICDGASHVVGGVDLNVQAVQAAFNIWKVGGYIIGNPTGASCVFTQQVAFTATAAVGNVTTPFQIDTRGGNWHSQVTATPVARFWSNTGGGDYSVCPTGLTVNGDASIPVTITCGQQVVTGSPNLAPAFAATPAYTASNWTEAAGTMSINFTGANSFSPTTPLTISAATGYCVTLTTYTASSGTLTVTLGGTTSSAVTPKAGATNVVCLTTVDTTNLTIQASTSGANIVLSSVLVQPMDLQVTKISMTTPNTGSAFSGHPTVVMTGGTLYPGGTPAGVIAILSGDFNFTVGQPSPPSGSLTIGGFKIEDSSFTDDGFGSAVLFNLESGAFDRATLGHVSLIHSTFRTTAETTTAFQGTGTFESLASNNRFIYSNSATGATAASAGYYGFALMVSQVGPASSEWEIDRNRSAGFDHGFYVNGGAMTVSNNQPLLSWEEGIWASSSRATISGNHTENTWANNPTGRTDRAAIFCQGNCTFVNDDDFIGTTVGQNNFAIRTFVPTNNQGVVVGGASLNEGQYGYTYAELAGAPGQNIAVWGIPRLNGAATSDYINASGGLTVTDSATLYNTGQSVGVMQWLQMGSPPSAGGFYAIGPSNSSINYAETYRAVRTTPGAFLVTGDYTDASGVRHDQHCNNFTGVTPPLLGTPTGCVDARSFTPGGNPLNLSGVGVSAGKTYTFDPEGGQIPIGPSSSVTNNMPSFSSTTGGLKDSGIVSANLSRFCGESTFSAGTSGTAVTCAWVVSTSHCDASWKGTPGAGILGVTAGTGSATPSASASSTGTASLFCSVN